ncbi:MAG TPA: NUDIX hydrolase [Rectinemataceae bacterium]|nr:NUDIX hydrolase [Rectinemataceae bacterium]
MTEGGWKRGRVVERFDGKILDIKRVECESASGKRGVFTSVASRDWAIVVPLIRRDGHVSCVMVRQYRHGAEDFFLEFPGGIVEEGEDPAKGVGRELEEETGWKAGSIVHAGTVSPNPAFLENRFHVFVATGLDFHGRTDFDEHEEIETILVPFEEVRARMGEGELGNAMMVTGLFLAERVIGRLRF